MKFILLLVYLLLVFIYSPIIYCQKVNNNSYLTTNYTIDFFRNIEIQKCYSNEECPHYSNGCYISTENFINKGIISNDNDIKNLIISKEDLIKNNIYGICLYYYYCPENINTNIPNGNCIVKNGIKNNSFSYLHSYDDNLNSYDIKPGFYKNNITRVEHCNEKSIKKKYCQRLNEIYCKDNNDCFSNNCNLDNYCLNSNDFYIYICTNNFNTNTNTNMNTDGIENYAGCKKMDHEYCNDNSECENNYSVEGYCINKDDYNTVHKYDKLKSNISELDPNIIVKWCQK
ncbi:hypothetical protein BCR32DRAFT_285343 [Anaeromyces robustus]|uniref:Uncharacterized protein n=1 Tax=Anaeromyces robustus TaxID=1754192 RepID=A0A1Y1WP23_9FUNG|nr:hypothetical protein BCR32DRAFT_285343 [Anaeromyces robustus]|eukprot:ORX75287.1 hypothetical protein BCR32DRAFT_285343 [Anaeromyces robustus]